MSDESKFKVFAWTMSRRASGDTPNVEILGSGTVHLDPSRLVSGSTFQKQLSTAARIVARGQKRLKKQPA
jgi:hypothetical protein